MHERSLTMMTHKVKPSDIKKQWVVIDAAGQTLGRLASQVAYILRGKNKVQFTPNYDTGDNVVVINAAEVVLTGNKLKEKNYYHHTGYIGGIKSISAQDLLKKNPERLIEFAVRGMLPHNTLGRNVGKNLKVYAGTEHPHLGQKPVAAAPRLAGK